MSPDFSHPGDQVKFCLQRLIEFQANPRKNNQLVLRSFHIFGFILKPLIGFIPFTIPP